MINTKNKLDKYKIIDKLGQGSFGQVLLVESGTNYSQFYAMKRLNQKHLLKFQKSHEPYIEKQILNKFKLLSQNSCVGIYQTFSDSEFIYLILEYCQGGPLNKFINDKNKFSPQAIVKISAKILIGLQQIHSYGVIHRDLKPSNILVTLDGKIKISDFGTAYAPYEFYQKSIAEKIKSIKDMMETKKQQKTILSIEQRMDFLTRRATFVGTPLYMAPQLLKDDICGVQADLWAFGCIIHQLITQKSPFFDNNHGKIWKKILTQDFNHQILNNHPKIPYASDLIQGLLQKQPSKRLGCSNQKYQQIKKHPFFSIINWNQIYYESISELSKIIQERQTLLMMKKSSTFYKQQIIMLTGVVGKKAYFGNFKERLLVLNSSPKLLYYDPSSGQQKGQIILEKDTPIQYKQKQFWITTSRKTYYFESDKCRDWVQMIKAAIVKAYYQ